MNHITDEQWLAYVKDELDEKVRTHYDDHLFTCDECLALYVEALEVVEQHASIITTDEIIQNINQKVGIEQSNNKERSFYKKALFHYTVAAAMTLVLMSSGIFSQLIHVVSDIESEDENRSSIISKIMNSSISIIDQVEVKEGE